MYNMFMKNIKKILCKDFWRKYLSKYFTFIAKNFLYKISLDRSHRIHFEYMFPWILFNDGMIYYEKLFSLELFSYGNCNHCLIRLISFLEMGLELNCQYCHVYNTTYICHV